MAGVPTAPRQIFAYSGVLYPEPGGQDSFALIEYALSLAGRRQGARVCYVPTAVGDAAAAIEACTARFARHPAEIELSALRLFTQPSVPDVRAHLLGQDMILVEGGSVVNLMAVWRAHGLPAIVRECWERGVVLAGTSAGSLCWHIGGPTDSYRDALDPFTDGMALVPYCNGVHDDLPDQPRRETYRRMVAEGVLPAGYATEDGVGLHYVGTELREAVSALDGKRAWRVQPANGTRYHEEPITPRLI
jgi:peptidase E